MGAGRIGILYGTVSPSDVYANALESSGQCLLEIISYDWCGWTEEEHINLMQDSHCSGKFVNLTLSPKTNVDLVWFGLVYLFIHSVTYVTLDTSITDYNLQHNL
jgi:hypothetical protein